MESIGEILSSDKIDFKDTGILNLAYLGDSVWELLLRKYFVEKNMDTNNLSKRVKEFVNARKQSEIYLNIFDSLSEEAQNISKRARNAKIKSFPKSCNYMEYRNATAFEVLIAYYFLSKKYEEIEKILKIYIEGVKE